ncbi:MAG: hypothetical protein JW820_11535, partial [Spirochaetales bacterium]|nr:hypothetical protein [Spirochaetales bacterium]
RPHSILEHSLPDAKMERLYREDDWESLVPEGRGSVELRGRLRPCAVFENEDDLTTAGGEALARRLEEVLDGLWLRCIEAGSKKKAPGKPPGP